MQETLPDSDAVAVTQGDGALPLARWVGLAVLLGVEILFLGLLFDTEVFAKDPRWWAGLMRHSPRVPQVILAVAVATLILGRPWLKAERERLLGHRDRSHRAALYLAGHLAAFAGFAALTASVWDESMHPTPFGGGKMLAWALAGAATVGLWAASAVPHRLWIGIARRGLGVLAFAALIGVTAWNMGHRTQSLWTPLSRLTFRAVATLLRLVFRQVVCDPDSLTLGTSTFAVSIAPQCSGYEGIGLIWTFLVGALWFFRDRFRFPRAFLLFPIGAVVIWVANVVRIAALVAVGTLMSPEIACGGFHSVAGWISFNLVGLGLIVVAQRCPFFAAPGARAEVGPRSHATAAYLMPLLTLLGTAMVTGAFSVGFDRYYPLRVAAAAAVLVCYRSEYSLELRPTWSWSGVGIGVMVFVIWMALEPRASDARVGYDPGAELSPTWAGTWLLARVLGSVVVVPLAEELAFRGYLIRRLIAADFRSVPPGGMTWVSLAASSAAFGALHGRWLAGTLAGVCYALALHRRGKLGDAVLAHATTNALIAAVVLATRNWSLWS
jgi:exosortase E/protease (VPEID-CTERM system)